MARTKASPKPKPETGGKSIAFRATSEYAAWVDRLALADRSTVAALLDRALVTYAKEIGFKEQAPER